MSEVYDEEAPELVAIGDIVSFLYFTKDNFSGKILDVQRLHGRCISIDYSMAEPYLVCWHEEGGKYRETYAALESTVIVQRRRPPLENGPRKKTHIDWNEEDFRP